MPFTVLTMNVTTVSPTASGDNENVSPLLITLEVPLDVTVISFIASGVLAIGIKSTFSCS